MFMTFEGDFQYAKLPSESRKGMREKVCEAVLCEHAEIIMKIFYLSIICRVDYFLFFRDSYHSFSVSDQFMNGC